MTETSASKTATGRFFEDFRIGETIRHATPRTLDAGDASLYSALYGTRFAPQSAETFARAIGYPASPIDDLLAFHVVFGKTVPDISLNAVANLGYADCRFLKPVYPGDTLSSVSEVIGLKENSNRQSGVVYVRSRGFNQRGETVVDYVRWVMVRKRDDGAPRPRRSFRNCPRRSASPSSARPVRRSTATRSTTALSGSPHRFEDYEPGERIDHVDGVTVEEAEHMIATRLYQNTAKVHFNQHSEGQGRFGRRLIYGGHVISLARALSFNGLANAFHIAAINGGRHVAPLFAGDTLFAWSEVVETAALPGRDDVGALRIRTIAAKNRPCADFPLSEGDGYEPNVVLDLDYWALDPAPGLTLRLPADATLIIVGAEEATPRAATVSATNLASLIAAWRREGCRSSICASRRAGGGVRDGATPVDGEIVRRAGAAGAFAGTGLEASLDDSGATTLVLCGALGAVEPTARDAAASAITSSSRSTPAGRRRLSPTSPPLASPRRRRRRRHGGHARRRGDGQSAPAARGGAEALRPPFVLPDQTSTNNVIYSYYQRPVRQRLGAEFGDDAKRGRKPPEILGAAAKPALNGDNVSGARDPFQRRQTRQEKICAAADEDELRHAGRRDEAGLRARASEAIGRLRRLAHRRNRKRLAGFPPAGPARRSRPRNSRSRATRLARTRTGARCSR